MELHARIHEDDDGSYWAEVVELPGCFASGATLDELKEALFEAIEMCAEPVAARVGSAPNGDRVVPRLDEMKLVTA